MYKNGDSEIAKKCKETRRRVKFNSKIEHDVMTIRHARVIERCRRVDVRSWTNALETSIAL